LGDQTSEWGLRLDSWDLSQLRPDLEWVESDQDLLLYDPARREVFELDAADLPVLHLLDGQHPLEEIAAQIRRPLGDVLDLVDDLADEMLLVDPDQDEFLSACRAEHEVEDRRLQPALDSVLLTAQDLASPGPTAGNREIHVVDDARHTCRRCGACCHYAVPVSLEERRRLEAHAWPAEVIPEEAGRLFAVQPGLQWGGLEETTTTRSEPTRCAFLDQENLCRIHGALGPAAKPFSCRLFPLAYPVFTTNQVVFSLTFECPWVWDTYDDGALLADRGAELAGLAAEMEEVYVLPAEVPLDEERTLEAEGYLAWERGLLEAQTALADGPATGAAWFLETVQACWEELVPGGRSVIPTLAELVELAHALARAMRENYTVMLDSPEGEEGVDVAVVLLENLSRQPETFWADVHWMDGPTADRFLDRFVRHFIEGKQVLFYPTLWTGLRALAVMLLLARRDAQLVERAAGRERVYLATLNRALARWGRLLDLRPVRLAFLSQT